MVSHHTQNVTVPWVPTADFDWSFARSGPLPWNQTVWSLLAVFTALPIWMTVELTARVFYTFRRYKGLYFYSVLACIWGTTLHAIGFVLKWCVPQCNWIISTVLAEIGWVGMVTGFSVVLFSRLKLLVQSPTVRNVTLAMIITDALLFHVPTIVFQFLVSNKPTHKEYLPYMAPMERVQVMAFSIQETIISLIYIHSTLRYLKGSFQRTTRKTIALLIWIQVVVILADIIVITLDYCEYFTLKAVLHSFVYAFKLKLEFVILNDVKAMAGQGGLAPANHGQIQFGLQTPPASPPARPSGKKWWASRLHLAGSQTPSVNSASEPRLAHPEKSPAPAGQERQSESSSQRTLPAFEQSAFVTMHPDAEERRQ